MGLWIASRRDVIITQGTLTLKSKVDLVYVGEVPGDIRVDGAFGDWSGISGQLDSDEDPVRNENVDYTEYKISADSKGLFLFFKVRGTMMGGTAVPMIPEYQEYGDIPVPNSHYAEKKSCSCR